MGCQRRKGWTDDPGVSVTLSNQSLQTLMSRDVAKGGIKTMNTSTRCLVLNSINSRSRETVWSR